MANALWWPLAGRTGRISFRMLAAIRYKPFSPHRPSPTPAWTEPQGEKRRQTPKDPAFHIHTGPTPKTSPSTPKKGRPKKTREMRADMLRKPRLSLRGRREHADSTSGEIRRDKLRKPSPQRSKQPVFLSARGPSCLASKILVLSRLVAKRPSGWPVLSRSGPASAAVT